MVGHTKKKMINKGRKDWKNEMEFIFKENYFNDPKHYFVCILADHFEIKSPKIGGKVNYGNDFVDYK